MDISFSLNQKSSRRSVQKVPNSNQSLKMVTANNKIESKKESEKKDSSGLSLVSTNKIISLQKKEESKKEEPKKQQSKKELQKKELQKNDKIEQDKIDQMDIALHAFIGDIYDANSKMKKDTCDILQARLKALRLLAIEGKDNALDIFAMCRSEYNALFKAGLVSMPCLVGMV